MKGMQMGSPSSVWLLGLRHFVFSVCAGEIYAAGQGVQEQGREGEQHISQLVTVGTYQSTGSGIAQYFANTGEV